MTADTSSILCFNESYKTLIFILTRTNNKTMWLRKNAPIELLLLHLAN